MNILEVTKEEYDKAVSVPFSAFDTVKFCELNRTKVDEIKYLIFNDGKNKLGIVAGVHNGVIKMPFSAPYAAFSAIGKNDVKVSCYHEAVRTLLEYVKSAGLTKVNITLPPSFYDYSNISKMYNSLYCNEFIVADVDLNYQYNLKEFSDNYEVNIDAKARQKLRSGLREGLEFEKTDNIDVVYDIIRQNRLLKGYPLKMGLDDVLYTIKIVDADLFLVRDISNNPIASAMVYHVKPNIAQVVYWGNVPDSDGLKPMNYMAFKCFEYYAKQGFDYLDIGPSTKDSVPNYGLCDFKHSIGCKASEKITFVKEL